MIDWAKLRAKKNTDAGWPATGPVYAHLAQYEDISIEEAMLMSGTDTAHGYDILGRGPDHESPLVVEITQGGVQFLVASTRDKKWIEEVKDEPSRHIARKSLVESRNWTSWTDLLPINLTFLESLFWIPYKPLNAMEVLAKAAR